MSALIKRLRLSQNGVVKLHESHYQKDCGDAADEIERLSAALVEACDIALGTDLHREAVERIVKLRAFGE